MVLQIAAEDWRGRFLIPKDQRGRDRSKLTADVLAGLGYDAGALAGLRERGVIA